MKLLVEAKDLFLDLLLDDDLPLPFPDFEVGPQEIQDGQIGHGAAIVDAAALQVGEFFLREAVSELQEESGFAHPGLPHDAHHLAGAGL